MSKSALIFGASGVTGWAFVNEILNDYPKKGIWGSVHALTNRPLKLEDSLWPSDERLNIVSGIDLLAGSQEELEATIKSKITGIEKVTHVYYLAYKASKDYAQELADAVAMFKRSTLAIDHLSPALEFVVLQTGAKMYGCHLLENHPTDYLQVPHKESQPRLKAPYHDALFYHPQLDWLEEYAKDKSWSWCDTRPDIIIGFVPNQNFYSLGQSVATFLTLWREVEGEGSTCPYPGTQTAWVAKSIDSSSDMIARQTLHLSLSPETEKGGGYNVADAKYALTWETKWPALCKYFGLKGVAPTENPVEVRTYIKEHMDVWNRLEKENGLKTGIVDSDLIFKGFEYFLLTQFDFDRQYDMTKMYGTGFEEERNTIEAWGPVFDRIRAAKIIP
jgi:nucleoside-diphosphate-sugar epimerase